MRNAAKATVATLGFVMWVVGLSAASTFVLALPGPATAASLTFAATVEAAWSDFEDPEFWDPNQPMVGEQGTIDVDLDVSGVSGLVGVCFASTCLYSWEAPPAEFDAYGVGLEFPSGRWSTGVDFVDGESKGWWSYTDGPLLDHLEMVLAGIDVETLRLDLETPSRTGSDDRLDPQAIFDDFAAAGWAGSWQQSDNNSGTSGTAVVVPEPATGLLLTLGLAGLTVLRRNEPSRVYRRLDSLRERRPGTQ